MKRLQIALAALIAIVIVACSTSKKSTAPIASVPVPAATPPEVSVAPAKPANGVYAPADEELAAIRAQYPDATMEKLKEGYVLYTVGACVKCHEAKNIYKRGIMEWKFIVEDMAAKAKISDEQKDAVYKYVMAIKAVQAKEVH